MSENGLNILMKRIIKSDYISMEELVKDSDTYSIDEIHVFLDHIIAKWEANELTPAAINALLRFVYVYLDRPDVQISYKNRTPLPICYFSSFLHPSALFFYSFLKTLSFAVTMIRLDKTDHDLKEYIEKMKPSVIIFTISQFLHVETLKQLVPYLLDRDLKIIIGGVPFEYDESMKQGFSDCIFPRGMTELVLLLENSIKRDLK